jgi:hypothetical protein
MLCMPLTIQNLDDRRCSFARRLGAILWIVNTVSSVKFDTVNPEHANILNPSSPNYTAWHAVAMLAQLCLRGTPRPRLSP